MANTPAQVALDEKGQGALVERLRKAADEMREEGQKGWPVTCDDAADRIEALTRKYSANPRPAAQPGVVKGLVALDEGIEILANLLASVRKHGNYSPEATITFLEQAGQCLWEARSALAALASPEERT